MTEHTQGLWTVEYPMGDDLHVIVQANKLTYEWSFIATITADVEDGRKRISKAEAKANAHLIKAAPQMLAALERVERWIEQGGEVSPLDEVHAAIAAARASEDCAAMHAEELPRAAFALLSVDRPTISNADEWQLWLDEHKDSGSAYLAVQIVEAIEEHQKALAREVYGLAEDAAARFSDLAAEDTPEGHYSRGAIAEAKSIARAINGIMPYSRNPGALAWGGRERLKGR